MHRRTQLFAAIVAMAAPFVVPALADTTPPQPLFPLLTCATALSDTHGDASADPAGSADLTSTLGGKTPELDIWEIAFRLTATQLQAFIAVAQTPDASTMRSDEAAYQYVITATFDGKALEYGWQLASKTIPSVAGPPNGPAYPIETFGPTSLPGSTVTMYPATSSTAPAWIVFTSPRPALEKATGGPIASTDQITGISANTYDYFANRQSTADSTATTGPGTTFTMGDDSCFVPPPTSIGSVSVAAAQYNHTSAMSAVLLDDAGKPLAGQPVKFAVGSTAVTGTTDSNGLAHVTYGPVKLKAGSYPVTVTYAGSDTHKASTATGVLKVSAESSSFKPLQVAKSGASRVVTATLVDNQNKPIAGATVTWYVNGKKAATAKTDKNGRAVLRSAKAGQSVQAKFAGIAGMVLPCASKAVKV